MTRVSLVNISKSFGSHNVLRDVSLEIGDGEFFSLLGPSGCGKSTLLRIIAGLEHADAGAVLLNGESINDQPPQNRGIGLVFQNYALWPHMTIEENILFGLKAQSLAAKECKDRLRQSLELVRLDGLNLRYPHELSGGQQQRVALARALAIRPRVLLMDEPLSNLDARLRVDIRSELAALHREIGTTTIYVTHDQDDALALSSRIAILQTGVVAQVDEPRRLYQEPCSAFVASFLGSVNLIPATISASDDNGYLGLTVPGASSLRVPIPVPNNSNNLEVGTQGLVCVRPEAIVTVAEPTNCEFYVDTILRREEYRGTHYVRTYEIENSIPLQQILWGNEPTNSIQIGTPCKITWAISHSTFLPADI